MLAGRVFRFSDRAFFDRMLCPETQDIDIFADSMNIILVVHRRAALLIVNNAEFDTVIPPNSAIQIGHNPTGITVYCADERSE
jgi:hypothetical protein